MPRSKRVFALLAAALVIAPGVALAKAKIIYKNGQETEVDSISQATYKKVVFKILGSRQEARAAEVQDLVPDDSYTIRGMAAYKAGKFADALNNFKRATSSRTEIAKSVGQFFYARCLRATGNLSAAAAEYSKFLAGNKEHFYAPFANFEGADCYLNTGKFSEASKLFSNLSKFGSDWEKKGAYGKGVAQLAEGKHAEAASTFSKVARSATGITAELAKLGEVRAKIAMGKGRSVASAISRVLSSTSSKPEVLGMAWLAQGESLKKDGKNKEAMYAFMRSLFLYGAADSALPARRGAVEMAKKLGYAGVANRTQGFATQGNYSGKKANAEFVGSLMRVSAGLAEEVAKDLVKKSRGDEKADIEFYIADTLRAQGKKDEYEKLLKDLQKRYPDHPRAQNAKLDILVGVQVDLGRRWSAAKDEAEDAKREKLQKEVQSEYDKLIGDMDKLVENKNKELKELDELEDFRQKYTEANIQKLRIRDFIRMKRIEVVFAAAKTYEKGDKKTKLLDRCSELLESFVEEAEQFSFDHIANAYKLTGQVYLEKGEFEAARYEFESLKEYEVPFQGGTPEARKNLKDFEKSTRIAGYRLFAGACVKAGSPQDAIAAFKNLEETFPNYRQTREGLLASFELAKCLSAAGRTSEALDQIIPLIENPEKFSVEGVSKEALKVEATKALAGISEASQGEIFPPKAQFAVGDGFKAAGDDESAIIGYKGVLTAAVSKADREEWVPPAVLEMGSLLYFQKRYIESVMAYRVLFTEFPSHPKAADAIKFARTAINEALKIYKEDETSKGPIYKLKEELDDALKKLDSGGLTGLTLIMKEAAAFQTKRKYKKAAASYLQIPADYTEKDKESGKETKKPVPYYPGALANAGYCFFKAYQESKDESLLKKASSNLNKALDVSRKRKDKRSEAIACYYLGEVYNSGEKYKEAIDVLKAFDDRFAKDKRFAVNARAQQVTAYLKTNQPSEAVARFERVKDMDDRGVTAMALDLADWFYRNAAKIQEENPSDSKIPAYRKKAATYAALSINRSKKVTRSYLFWASAVITDGGLNDEAIKVYERLFKEFPRPKINTKLLGAEAKKATSLHDQYDLARLNLARAYLATDQVKKAEKAFTNLYNLCVIKRKTDEVLVERGYLEKEENKVVSGMSRQTKVFTLKVDGKSVQFMVPERNRAPTVVRGTSKTSGFGRNDYLILRQRFKSNFMVLESLANSRWELYQKNRDKKYLVTDVQDAWNRLYLFIFKSVDEGSYAGLAASYNLEEKNYYEKTMTIAYRLLEIAYARQDYKRIVGDVNIFEQKGMFKGISEDLINKFKKLRDQAKNK